MRRAARVDDNQADIVDALRKIGASVYVIGLPVDLLCGYRGRSIALEVKSGDNWRLTQVQKDFFAEFKGEAYIVDSVKAALKEVRGA